MNCLILGYGEVGKGVHEAFKDWHKMDWIDKEQYDFKFEYCYEILIVCLPYSNEFIDVVKDYQNKLKPKATLIFSTVPIGTSRLLRAVHCPVEGRHPDLGTCIRIFDRHIGGVDAWATRFFREANIQTHSHMKPETTELAKLQSTTNYGINIEFAREVKKVCDEYGIDYRDVKAYNESYNDLYQGTQFKRYILEPPDGKIGGHCILQNLPLFKKDFRNKFIEILEDNNE